MDEQARSTQGCAFCKGSKSYGEYLHGFHMGRSKFSHNGETVFRQEIMFDASSEVFGNDIEVSDWMAVYFCPICGKHLLA